MTNSEARKRAAETTSAPELATGAPTGPERRGNATDVVSGPQIAVPDLDAIRAQLAMEITIPPGPHALNAWAYVASTQRAMAVILLAEVERLTTERDMHSPGESCAEADERFESAWIRAEQATQQHAALVEAMETLVDDAGWQGAPGSSDRPDRDIAVRVVLDWPALRALLAAHPAEPESVFSRHPEAFDDRQRPICGHWSPLLGPCICGDPANHVGGAER